MVEGVGAAATIWSMTAKEKLLRDVLDLDEARAARAQIVVTEEPEPEPEMASLPEAWRRLPSGAPTPNWVALLDEARRGRS